jgi:hypothetical protein
MGWAGSPALGGAGRSCGAELHAVAPPAASGSAPAYCIACPKVLFVWRLWQVAVELLDVDILGADVPRACGKASRTDGECRHAHRTPIRPALQQQTESMGAHPHHATMHGLFFPLNCARCTRSYDLEGGEYVEALDDAVAIDRDKRVLTGGGCGLRVREHPGAGGLCWGAGLATSIDQLDLTTWSIKDPGVF